jgi:hypothetical protein
MAGIRRLVQRRLTFSFPSNFAASSSAMLPLSLDVNTLGWVSGVLEVILYTKSISGTGATAKVVVANVISTSDGRGATSVSQTYVAEVTITDGTQTNSASPKLHAASFAAPICSQVGVLLLLASAGAAASGDLEIEVWLVGRDA